MKNPVYLTIVILLVLVALPGEEMDNLHDSWDSMLHEYVNDGKVNYQGFAKDMKRLDHYLKMLEKTDIDDFSHSQKLAFWINAYNAFTIKLILMHYPIKSIRKISRPWKQRIWKAAGKTLSLDNIEHKILRKDLKEPRIHFAIVCASIGCPDLQSHAFRGETVKGQLDQVARKFFKSKKHFHIKKEGEKAVIYISKIFRWFGEDFGENLKEKVKFIINYLEPSKVKILEGASSVKMKYLSYDWNLNV